MKLKSMLILKSLFECNYNIPNRNSVLIFTLITVKLGTENLFCLIKSTWKLTLSDHGEVDFVSCNRFPYLLIWLVSIDVLISRSGNSLVAYSWYFIEISTLFIEIYLHNLYYTWKLGKKYISKNYLNCEYICTYIQKICCMSNWIYITLTIWLRK